MPRKAIDYSKTIIYKLVKNDDYENENVYVGSTTDFVKRKNCHKSKCCNENNKLYNLKVYQNIRENGGWENWKMIELEKFPCNDNNEAHAREEYWRCEFNAKLNTIRAFTTKEQKIKEMKQYYTENADKMKEYGEKYRTENSDKIKQLQKQYKTENADKIKQLQKQYYTEHAEKMKKQMNQYYTENAEKIHQKYDCDCGGKYTHQNKSSHFKTKRHMKYINNKN